MGEKVERRGETYPTDYLCCKPWRLNKQQEQMRRKQQGLIVELLPSLYTDASKWVRGRHRVTRRTCSGRRLHNAFSTVFGGRDTRWLGAGAGGGRHPREGACYLSRTRPGNWVQLCIDGFPSSCATCVVNIASSLARKDTNSPLEEGVPGVCIYRQ